MRAKRSLIEQERLKARFTHGRGSFHLENLNILGSLVRAGLRTTGLLARGKRNALDLVVRSVRFDFDSLPKSFCGLTVLHISDLHIDGIPGLTERICEKVRDLEADVCVLTGDYRFGLTSSPHYVYPHMEKILDSVNARYGTIGILGNHDSSDMIPGLERMGVKMLVNGAWELRNGVESVWFVGLDDPHYFGCDDLDGALDGVPPEAFKILLVHSPELFDEADKNGASLYLCGHTHGGQVCLPILGPLIVNSRCPRRYARGAWRHNGLRGYTSAGAGSAVVPVRFGCPPEIGLIELRSLRDQDGGSGGA